MPADNVTPAKRKAPEEDALAHHSALVNGLSRFFGMEELADVDLILDDGTTLPGHTVVLASQEYFRMLLVDSGLKEASQPRTMIPEHHSGRRRVVLKDVDPEPFKAVLQYIYQGPQSVSISSPAQAMQILELADLYGIRPLCEKVVESLTVVLGRMEPEERIRSCLGLLVAVKGRVVPGIWEELYTLVVTEAQKLMPQLVQASKDQSGQDLLSEMTPETLNDLLCGDALAAPDELLVELVDHVVLPWCRRKYKKPAMDVPGLLAWSYKWCYGKVPVVASLELKVPMRGTKVSSPPISFPQLHKLGLQMTLELSTLPGDGCSSDKPFILRTVVDAPTSSSSNMRSLSPGALAAINFVYKVKHNTDSSRHSTYTYDEPIFFSSKYFSTYMILRAKDAELTDVNQGFMSNAGSLAIDVSMCFNAISAVVFGYVAAKFHNPGLAKAAMKVIVSGHALRTLLSCKRFNVPDELSVLTAVLESGHLNGGFRESLLKAIRWRFIPPSSALELAQRHPALKESNVFRKYTSELVANLAAGGGGEVMFTARRAESGPRDSYSSTATRERWPTSLVDLLPAANKGIEAIESKAAEDRRQLEQRIKELEELEEQALEQKEALGQRVRELEAQLAPSAQGQEPQETPRRSTRNIRRRA